MQSCLEKIWEKYKTAANYVEPNPIETATVPHELIEPVRKLINIVESKSCAEEAAKDNMEPNGWNYPIKEPEAEKTPVVGGSLHSDIDWNSKLGVPQYRTQSDNLSIPEATCNVTTMAMTLERLGNSRSDVIAAIDAKLKNGKEKTDDELKTLWEKKSEAYMKKISSTTKSDYKKLRAGSSKIGTGGDIVGKEAEISKIFKEIAQMEDLIDFYMYLKTSNLGERYDIFGDTYNDDIAEDINPLSQEAYDTERKNLYKKNSDGLKTYLEFEEKHRNMIKKTLDNGGSVVISINHKGTSGSHIVSVQSISPEGIYVDDPYGGHAPDYLFGEESDLFAGKGKNNKDRDGAGFQNIVHDNVNETDYTKRDFTAEAAQNLESDESRGDSVLLKWDMINKSSNGLINYMVFYEKN